MGMSFWPSYQKGRHGVTPLADEGWALQRLSNKTNGSPFLSSPLPFAPSPTLLPMPTSLSILTETPPRCIQGAQDAPLDPQLPGSPEVLELNGLS